MAQHNTHYIVAQEGVQCHMQHVSENDLLCIGFSCCKYENIIVGYGHMCLLATKKNLSFVRYLLTTM